MSRMGKLALLGFSLVYAHPATAAIRRYSLLLFDTFPMQGDVQAFAFLFLANAQTHRHIDNFQDDETGNKAVANGKRNAFELNPQRAVHATDFLADKDPG